MPDPKLDIKVTTSADTRGADQTAKALDGVAQAGERLNKGGAQFLNSTVESAKKGANALESLKRGGEDVGKVFGGLQQAAAGGVGGIVGMTRAVQGFIGVARGAALATGPIGILVTVLGTLAGLFLALKGSASDSGKALEGTASSADRLDKKLSALEKSASQSLKSQLAEVEKLKTGYTELIELIDSAEQRNQRESQLKLNNTVSDLELQRTQKLAAAPTDAQREKINKEFDKLIAEVKLTHESIAAENRTYAAQLRADAAVPALSEAQTLQRAADARVGAATSAREAADQQLVSALTDLRGWRGRDDGGLPMIQEIGKLLPGKSLIETIDEASLGAREKAVADARAARTVALAEEKAAKTQAEEVRVQTQTVIVNAAKAIDAAPQTATESAIQSNTIDAEREKLDVRPRPKLGTIDESRVESARSELSRLDSEIGITSSFGNPRYEALQSARAAAQANVDREEASVASARAANDKLRYEYAQSQRGASPAPAGGGRVSAYSGEASAAQALVRAQDGYIRTREGQDRVMADKFKKAAANAQKLTNQLRDSR